MSQLFSFSAGCKVCKYELSESSKGGTAACDVPGVVRGKVPTRRRVDMHDKFIFEFFSRSRDLFLDLSISIYTV